MQVEEELSRLQGNTADRPRLPSLHRQPLLVPALFKPAAGLRYVGKEGDFRRTLVHQGRRTQGRSLEGASSGGPQGGMESLDCRACEWQGGWGCGGCAILRSPLCGARLSRRSVQACSCPSSGADGLQLPSFTEFSLKPILTRQMDNLAIFCIYMQNISINMQNMSMNMQNME